MAELTLQTNPLSEHEPFTVEGFVALVTERNADSWYDTNELTIIGQRIAYWTDYFEVSPRTVAGQILHETGFFRYGGDVYWWQFNFAGLGATGGVIGHSFTEFNEMFTGTIPELPDPTTRSSSVNSARYTDSMLNIPVSIDAGILAVVVHHLVYLRGMAHLWPEGWESYKHADPRYNNVVQADLDGSVTTIEDYGGKWAYPGVGYGQKIIDIGNLLPVREVVVGRPKPFVLSYPMMVSHVPWNNSNRSRETSLASGRGWITIHETGNFNVGANAKMHRGFCHGKNGFGGGGHAAYTDAEGTFHKYYEGVLFNYVQDDTEVFELAPRGEKTWQASDGAGGPGNSSVSIELCVNADGNWNTAKDKLIELVVWLIAHDSNLDVSRIAQHNTWARDGKNCPTRLRANNNREWNILMVRIKELAAEKAGPVIVPPDPNALQVNGFWIVNDIYHRWSALGDLTLPMIGYPVSPMFEGPIDGVMREVQFFERGALAVYKEGTEDGVPEGHPFRVRMLTDTEYHEAYTFGVKDGFIKE